MREPGLEERRLRRVKGQLQIVTCQHVELTHDQGIHRRASWRRAARQTAYDVMRRTNRHALSA